MEQFNLDFLNTTHYENISSMNLTSNIFSPDKNDLNWPILTLSILVLTGTLGNLLVCISISLDKQLQTVTNWFLFSLAIADCLVSFVVLPLSIIKDFQGSWQLPIIICNLFVFFDVLLCTTSIWHLTILSIDRFLHISCPFRSRERSKRKTFLTILCIWTFSIAISCIILILGCTDEKNILIIVNEHRHYCALNNRSFIIYGSIICFCIPCILMLVTYSLTVRRLQLEAAKCYADPDDHVAIKRQASDRLRRHRLSSKRYRSSRHHQAISSKEISSSSIVLPCSSTVTDTDNTQSQSQPSSPPVIPIELPHSHPRSFLHNALVKKAAHAFKSGPETTSERRAMKVLGIVFFVFLVAWLPFSILNILSAVCPSCAIKASLLNITSWLGYVSSNLNPIIYTAFNVRFRRAFVSILTCQTNYFSHKRKGNNLYIFVATNNQQQIPADHERYFFPSRRFLNERKLKQKNYT
ncbi:unnamed protein product [Rotaria magnacalcarata]|uniref:G-protein coupled receptors family 1 profile domain-containing protein n=3 Tax=Rotaria magnacalcarata TaxID=392030 RepID=A0A816KC33_9BILA|nr:unnamed protein product [Rotaria magnacalcarata]CAF1919688.1 unnamed protein product [Rotaria magnacalcarata]CAF3836521.1 unnamed protein product [Rotaria magnacalcarata]